MNEPMEWERGATSYQYLNDELICKEYFHTKVKAMDIPALIVKAAELRNDGFALTGDEIIRVYKVVQTRPNKQQVFSYEIRSAVYFINGTTALTVNVYCGFAYSLDEAIRDVIVTNGNLVHLGDPIEGGKGQLNRCKEIAENIFSKFGHLIIDHNNVVCVEYKTRGGKGGWAAKIAERRFYPTELMAVAG